MKGHLFWVLVLERLIGLHRTTVIWGQRYLLLKVGKYWLKISLRIALFLNALWPVSLEHSSLFPQVTAGWGGLLFNREVVSNSFATPWAVAHHAPVHGIFQARIWSGLPFPSPGNVPKPEIEPVFPTLAGGSFATEPPGKPRLGRVHISEYHWDHRAQLSYM